MVSEFFESFAFGAYGAYRVTLGAGKEKRVFFYVGTVRGLSRRFFLRKLRPGPREARRRCACSGRAEHESRLTLERQVTRNAVSRQSGLSQDRDLVGSQSPLFAQRKALRNVVSERPELRSGWAAA